MWKSVRRGIKYMKVWPNHAVVGNMTEAKVIPATRLGARVLPIAAVANFFVQFQYLGMDYLPQIIGASLFILLLPLQGYYWLGQRAYRELPPPLKHWYFELKQKLNDSGEDIRLPSHRPGPCYIDLARVLRTALTVLPPEER
ncbi:terminus macrodomain insulation protein YfbV [Aliidiomarina indica]|uniref:terminus macrodomain insulation protein YfbV n=1 Tax=Aliidiomarina indica TaxID=2749147 RepID=UPI00188F0FE2|nr:terminus macrodomain insulation protein YfbV [Aliidiomarina indica]